MIQLTKTEIRLERLIKYLKKEKDKKCNQQKAK